MSKPTVSSPRRVFFFVHTPKCAGTTFRSILRRNLGPDYLEEYRLLEPRELRYRADDLGRLLAFLPKLRGFSGHCISCDLPFDQPDAEVIGLGAVRDPIERILSWYSFNRNTHHYDLVEKHQELGTYLEFLLAEYDFAADPWRLCQVPDLVDRPGAAGLERITELAARDRLVLFPMTRFDEMMCWLESRWPDDFADTTYGSRENISRYDQSAAGGAIGKLLDRLRAHPALEADLQLHELAHRELDRQVARLPGGTEAFAQVLARFESRQRRAERRERWVHQPLRRLRHRRSQT